MLCSLGVGHEELAKVYELSLGAGYPCKLTGAGGGGCAITLTEVLKIRAQNENAEQNDSPISINIKSIVENMR